MDLKFDSEIRKELSKKTLMDYHKSKIAEYNYLVRKYKELRNIHKEKLKELKIK